VQVEAAVETSCRLAAAVFIFCYVWCGCSLLFLLFCSCFFLLCGGGSRSVVFILAGAVVAAVRFVFGGC
jgi:hypothetical protein